MTHPEELHHLIDALPESAREEARVFLVELIDRTADEKLQKLRALIWAGEESIRRGDTYSAEEVFAELGLGRDLFADER